MRLFSEDKTDVGMALEVEQMNGFYSERMNIRRTESYSERSFLESCVVLDVCLIFFSALRRVAAWTTVIRVLLVS